MQISDPDELKLIEKYREILGKRGREGDPEISRTFTVPDPRDSDVLRHISVGVRYGSGVASTGSMELITEREKVPEKFRSPFPPGFMTKI